MASRIPDEILNEILSPALKVPEEAFSAPSTGFQSPFYRDESSSAFLLVSKSWLRVATPLLYNVVIIRSKAQAQALAIVFRANPDLGRFVRKLRVEGGYASSMHKILQTSKNITDLFITLDMPRSDNTCGLCRGLPLIDPARVIIHCSPTYYTRRGGGKLVDVLTECIQKWKNLSVAQVSHHDEDDSGPLDDISRALKNAKSLDTLVISDEPHYELFQEWEIPEYISIIATNPSLRHIRLRAQPRGDVTRSDFYKELQRNVRLEALFNLPAPITASATKPFIYPAKLAADRALEDLIWSRVLYYVLCERDQSDYLLYDSDSADDDCGPLASLLVSKKIARLGIPHLYESPRLETAREMKRLTARLKHQPSLGSLVRHLSIKKYYGDQDLKSLVSHTPSLVSLRTDLSITWKVFNDLCKTTGSSLRDVQVSIAKPTAPVSPGIFSLLPQIHRLAWDCKTVFSTGPTSISVGTFDALADLSVEAFDPSFLTVLSRMELPSLRSVTFGDKSTGGDVFLKKHGKKLVQLTVSVLQIMDSGTPIFRHCPSLASLGISCDAKNIPSADTLKLSESHACLAKIVFKSPSYYDLTPTEESELMLMFSDVDRTRFPALREIQHPSCIWPTTERETAKSWWASWAESLLDQDIRLVDEKGVGWRRRLQFTKKN
ncbi:hypothetical protein B0H17DRAFT_1076266, partial [Mycena rosella]